MGLRAVFRAALPGIFRSAGEPAVFLPVAGGSIACNVFIDFAVLLQPAGLDTQVWQQGTTIEALLSEILAEPVRDDFFEVDGISYRVQSVIANDGLSVKVAVI